MAVGVAEGENRAVEAAERAVESSLLDVTIDGAQGILFNITSGANLSLFEVNEAAEIIKRKAHPEANIIFGAVIDESLDDELHITLIATGFDAIADRKPFGNDAPRRQNADGKTIAFPQPGKAAAPAATATAASASKEQPPVDYEPVYDPDNRDVPAFIRRRLQKRRVS